jgi:hypothetical protein
MNSKTLNQTNVTATDSETAYLHLGDVRDLISKIREKIDFYKG